MKLTDLTIKVTLAVAIVIVPPTSLVVPRLGTTNDGSGMTLPAEAKIIVDGPHNVSGGDAMPAASTLMHVSKPVCPGQQFNGQQLADFWKGY